MTRGAFAGALVALLVGCGQGGEGKAPPLPSSGPGTAPALGGGADRGSGADRGGGTTSAFGIGGTAGAGSGGGGGGVSGPAAGTQTCMSNAQCPAGSVCSEDSGKRLGHCITLCSPPPGVSVSSGYCPRSTEDCIRSGNAGIGGCFRRCTSEADCPTLEGLVKTCVGDEEGRLPGRWCLWESPEPPSTTVPDAGLPEGGGS